MSTTPEDRIAHCEMKSSAWCYTHRRWAGECAQELVAALSSERTRREAAEQEIRDTADAAVCRERELRTSLLAKLNAAEQDLAAERARGAAIRALVFEWRSSVSSMAKRGWLQSIRRDAVEKCSDELEALLKASA